MREGGGGAYLLDTTVYYSYSFPSDACDPSWRNTRDGRIGSAVAVSILTFFLAVAGVLVHVYYHTGEKIRSSLFEQIRFWFLIHLSTSCRAH